jgi:hypothetical protein
MARRESSRVESKYNLQPFQVLLKLDSWFHMVVYPGEPQCTNFSDSFDRMARIESGRALYSKF